MEQRKLVSSSLVNGNQPRKFLLTITVQNFFIGNIKAETKYICFVRNRSQKTLINTMH